MPRGKDQKVSREFEGIFTSKIIEHYSIDSFFDFYENRLNFGVNVLPYIKVHYGLNLINRRLIALILNYDFSVTAIFNSVFNADRDCNHEDTYYGVDVVSFDAVVGFDGAGSVVQGSQFDFLLEKIKKEPFKWIDLGILVSANVFNYDLIQHQIVFGDIYKKGGDVSSIVLSSSKGLFAMRKVLGVMLEYEAKYRDITAYFRFNFKDLLNGNLIGVYLSEDYKLYVLALVEKSNELLDFEINTVTIEVSNIERELLEHYSVDEDGDFPIGQELVDLILSMAGSQIASYVDRNSLINAFVFSTDVGV